MATQIRPKRPWQDRHVTDHFTLGEFACDHRGRPPKYAEGKLLSLCVMYLEPLRAAFGPVTINSACRTKRHNAAVGGAPESWHLWHVRGSAGVAVDCRCAEGHPSAWGRFLDQLNVNGLGIYGTYVHVDNRSGSRARWIV